MSDMRDGRPIDRTGERPGGGVNGVLILLAQVRRGSLRTAV